MNVTRELAAVQKAVLELVASTDDRTMRTQYHGGLSPLGWHLGHCVYTECYWLREVVLGDNAVTAPLARLYVPPITPKEQRGAALPPLDRLLDWAATWQDRNLELLDNGMQGEKTHDLLRENYLAFFLLQHYCQHHETMMMVLAQRARREIPTTRFDGPALVPCVPRRDSITVPRGSYRVGGTAPISYDNELPAHTRPLEETRLARRPVSNGEYLAFMLDGGYEDAQWWDEAGWKWRTAQAVTEPCLWRELEPGLWTGVDHQGLRALPQDAPVCSISRHEAGAYARWAGARLPTETEWEVASREAGLQDSGQVWEWCANTFRPYPGFRPFPYPEYSTPWFDERHFPLRGGSRYTREPVKRASFRNFYVPDTRYLFSGVRLAWS